MTAKDLSRLCNNKTMYNIFVYKKANVIAATAFVSRYHNRLIIKNLTEVRRAEKTFQRLPLRYFFKIIVLESESTGLARP
jgi:hypothetical protein